jgi:hypothetical protein
MSQHFSNPYLAPSINQAPACAPLPGIPRFLLALFALILLQNGIQTASGFIKVFSLPNEIPVGSYEVSLMLRDGIYGLTALLGSSLLIRRSWAGWFATIAHWSLYIAVNVIIPACAALFAWGFPPRPEPTQSALALVFGMAGLSILLWNSVMNSCGVSARPMNAFVPVFAITLTFAFLVNWLAISHLW